MKFAIILALASLAVTAPPSADKELVITEEFFPDSFAIYTAKHDIVDIMFAFNQINLDEDDSLEDTDKITAFFVEADIKDNGQKEYKGLYVYKNGVAKKVLANGQCSTYAKDKIIYFGASDGIYKYNEKDQTATKYGTVTDSIIRLAINSVETLTHANVYYLTSDYVLYKYDEDEKVATKVEAVKDARNIVFDYDGIMFFYDGNYQFYTYNGERVLKIEGLPAHPSKVELIRCPVVKKTAFGVVDGRLYELTTDGKSEKTTVKFQSQPTAFGVDIITYQYYAYQQKLYLYNLDTNIDDMNIQKLSNFFKDRAVQINNVMTQKVFHKL